MPSQNTVRSTNVLLPQATGYQYCNGTLGEDSVTHTSATVNTEHLVKVTTNTPNYRALVRAKARLPDRPFTFSLARQSAGVLSRSWHNYNTCSSGWDVGQYWGTHSLSAAHYAQGVDVGEPLLTDHAIKAKILQRARGAEWQAPVFFAEAGQTVRMVTSAARDLARSFGQLRRGNLVGAYRTLAMTAPSAASTRRFNRQFGRNARDAAANRWLEMQYGWIPLLSDVKNAAETLAEATLDSAKRDGRVTAVERLFVDRDEPFVCEVSPPGSCRMIRKQIESRRMVWKFRPTSLSTLASFGLLNPASVAWELVPLSFVIDWFLPIGRYLEQLDTPFRFTHVGGTSVYRREVITTKAEFVRNGFSYSGEHESYYVLLERSVLTQTPSLGLESIVAEPNLGVRRMLSGLALAHQRFGR